MSKFNYRYDKQLYLELLKLKYLQKKVLTSTEVSELTEYLCMLDGTLDWETKEQYLDLLEKLISGKISSFEFYIEFLERNDLTRFETLEANFLLLSPHEKSNEFSNFILEIMDLCISYAEIFESYLPKEERDSYHSQFRNSIEEIYLRIQKILSLKNLPIFDSIFSSAANTHQSNLFASEPA